MTFLEASILGIIQGLTEWLPISSSAHIFLAQTYFGLQSSLELAAWLHGGSLLAVLLYYRKRLWKMLLGLFARNKDGILALKIILATAISVPVILLLKASGILYGLNLQTIAITLFITGLFILVSEYLGVGFLKFRSPTPKSELSWWLVATFGLVQGFAVLPGISRSGLTIAFLLLMGVARKRSVDFSFLAAIPLLLAALLFSVSDVGIGNISLTSVPLWFSLAVSFVASLVGIHYMRKWIEHKWVWFAPYCFALAIILFII